MSTVVVQRPTRRPSPEMPSGELILESPPEIPAPGGKQWTQALTFLPMLAMMAAMMIMFSGSMAGSLRYVVFGLFGVAMLGMVVMGFVNSGGPNKREMGNARRLYLRGMAQQRVRLLRNVHKQRDAMVYLHPEPTALPSLAGSYRLWERRPSDPDFAVTRIGTGPQSPTTVLVPPEAKPLEQLEPLSAVALRRFLSTYSAIPHLPLAVALTGFARIHLRGERTRTVALVRSMIAQLGTLHAPDDIRVAVCAGREELPEWDWLKWLPHALHAEKSDAVGPLRLVAPTITGIEAMLDDLLSTRPRFNPETRRESGTHLVVVLDGGELAGSDHLLAGQGVDGVSIVDMTTTPPRSLDRSALILDIGPEGALSTVGYEGHTELGTADELDEVTAEALARQLAPFRLTGARGEQALSNDLGLAELLDLGDPYAFDPVSTWVQRPNRDRLRVMFGIHEDGRPIEVDLKESAQDGMGPHGLLIGATGSGKSELLRTLVLSLAITHPPNSLNFTLIDFKGGATFTRLDTLPHTSAVITNLADELPLVDRMTDALNGELIRRQELLRAAGNYSSLRDYERARAAGAPLAEVPTLLVICDEFSELLSAKPDFIDTFVQIGRVGRSLGVHLLLASQRLEEGRLRGLDTHLSYRIGLRTFSVMDSRTVLGVNDAFELPRAPGHGFLKFSTEPMERFRSAYVSGVYRRSDGSAGPAAGGARPEVLGYSTAYAPAVSALEPAVPEPEEDEETVGESLLDVLVDRLAGKGTPAHQVWLPPLAEPPTLDGLLGAPVPDEVRGLRAPGDALAGRLRAVIGVVDRPFEQRRDPLEFDLSAGGGHAVVMGGPRSGKSTALRTLVTSLACTHTPAEVQFYCLDFGGGSLAVLRGLPHVGGVANRQNTGAVRRTVAQVASVLAERERRFAARDVDGIAAYREAKARGEFPEDSYGDVFLVVDGWQTLRKEFEDVEETVCDIAARGLAYGVHVVAACARFFELRPAVRDLFGSKAELRLGDPIDTMIDRVGALNVPESAPGRGLATSKHQMLLAVPRADGRESGTELHAATTALVEDIAGAWPGEHAPRVRLLPNTLPYEELPPRDDDEPGMRLTVGIAEQDLRPVRLDFTANPHFLLLGDAQAGKTGFLRVLARRITESYTPSQARILLVDHRRGLLGDVGPDHLLGYGTDAVSTRKLMEEAARGMAERLPGNTITPDQLRKRNWWSGPELFVLVDDYDLVATPMDNPFTPLLDYLPQGRDIGLHVVLTRRTGGAGRGLFETFMSRVRDVGSPGLLLSGDKDEGPLIGGLKPEPLPPGRGRLVSRGETPRLIQLGWLPPAE
ncbi:type VII secretion protein EccC [Amycolatopsis antarctica]|uniref:Type VII secretion protein EccC n=1 Tax=Amycolatopsis antarctica TaxID=1854586 RepID=A0A263CYZ7_9PSEU|nr:type VII secretion protein EccCa [Amycolatopsis antarctica]OZM71331.1 type VII secretion protein EccC [Amycolatopsis antarctica]